MPYFVFTKHANLDPSAPWDFVDECQSIEEAEAYLQADDSMTQEMTMVEADTVGAARHKLNDHADRA